MGKALADRFSRSICKSLFANKSISTGLFHTRRTFVDVRPRLSAIPVQRLVARSDLLARLHGHPIFDPGAKL